MKTTRYFEERVLKGRPEIQPEWCERVILTPLKMQVQSDGRVRYWGTLPEMGARILRVVTLEDGETLHNAFFDRQYRKKLQRESEEL